MMSRERQAPPRMTFAGVVRQQAIVRKVVSDLCEGLEDGEGLMRSAKPAAWDVHATRPRRGRMRGLAGAG